MTLDAKVFKAYDVRGVIPDELDADGAYRIARAYVDEFEPKTMAIGHDMRVSSPELYEATVRGALDAGANVDEIGLAATEMLYYAVCEHGYEGGIAVTASHNPKQYNGMKIVRRAGLPLGGDGGIEKVRDRALAGAYRTPATRGTLGSREVLAGFAERCLRFCDPATMKPMRVVIDASNGMGGYMLEPILEQLPIVAERCHFTPDGTFPNGEPNPLLPENRAFIMRTVAEQGADLGIAFDGDADRCFFIDDTGAFVPGDFVTALMAEALLQKDPGQTILYDVRASRAVAAVVEAAGGTALASRVGHAFIKHRMRKENALYAGEVSGHYYFRDFYSVDTGVVPALVMLDLISRSGKPLSELLAPLHARYFLSGEINSTVTDVALKLQEIKERYGPKGEGGTLTHLDGVSVDFPDWHFNVRPSNTEPLLRLNLEAFSQAEMEQRTAEVLDLIRS